MFRERGTVLREYEVGLATYMVIKEGAVVRKYEITNQTWSVLYEVDPVVRSCIAHKVRIECERLKADEDMAKIVTW